MSISNKINDLLIKNNLTAYELAKKSDLTTNAIYQLAKGTSKDVKLSTLIKIADALDISLDEFRE